MYLIYFKFDGFSYVTEMPYNNKGIRDIAEGFWVERRNPSKSPFPFRVISHYHTGYIYSVSYEANIWIPPSQLLFVRKVSESEQSSFVV